MPVFKRIDAQDVSRLVLDIERQGYAVIEHFLSTEQLESARDYVLRETHKHNSEYFALHGIKSVTGSLFEALSTSVRFRKMLADVQEAGLGRRVPEEEEIFPAVRCLQGKTGLKESNYFHYDATALTALVPVFIPNDTEQCGDFIMFPNTRRIRSSAAINIIEKALIQNPLSQKLMALLIKYNLLKPIKIKLVPGNLYIFWGYRSIHANEPCDPNTLRATVLLHYGDPHSHQWMSRLFLGANQRRARKINKKALPG
ncbi:hypothetical protein [Pseudomonas sp.]|uniref:hypothetical protein n=1 Tax=Pseudomonas sp. TaxID=306 RepID=UPI0028B16136|nr:hypothetical protein [Pseudomonas sp.]